MSNFMIDFEATQFSGRIISIGCVCERKTYKETFYTLVKPSKYGEKITQFITDLTGITNEMLEEAPTADQAFYDLYAWIYRVNEENTIPHFYCYGNEDFNFIDKTVKYMMNFTSITYALFIKGAMEDCSNEVKKFFPNSHNPVALNRVYNFLLHEDNPQNHNALDDAKKLNYVINHINELAGASVEQLPKSQRLKAPRQFPDIWYEWKEGRGQLWKANTLGSDENYKIALYNFNDNKTKYFDSLETATLWVFKYLRPAGKSVKNEENRNQVAKKIENSIQNKGKYFGMEWHVKTENNK